jgi:hypothetical protein
VLVAASGVGQNCRALKRQSSTGRSGSPAESLAA